MRKKLNFVIIAINIVAYSALLVGAPIAGEHDAPRAATYLAIFGSFGAFIMLLDIRQARVIKGLVLITAGLVYQLLYPKYFYFFVDSKTMPSDIVSHFEIFGQAILLACSGAGGSLIAVHADKTSADFDAPPSADSQNKLLEKSLSDNVLNTEKTNVAIDELNKKANIIILIMAFMLIIISVMLLK